jgi:glycosyltransferase involved in cell wall biosynthesis
MIAGASFTDVLVTQYARQVGEGSPHVFSALGLGHTAGRPVEQTTFRFAETMPFPTPVWPPQDVKGVLGALSAFALSSPPPGGAGHIRDGSLPRNLKHTFYQRLLWREYRRTLPRFFGRFDVFHWHCIDPSRLAALRLIPAGGKVVLQPWGSDLYRTSGVVEYTRQLHACRRADVITVASPEMREVLLAKFGRDLFPRTRLIRYGTEKLETIDAVKRAGNAALRRLSMPPDKRIVCVGTSASRGNQHLEILRSLSRLPASIASRIGLVLPMTYGADPGYLAAVREAIPASVSDAVILDEPLSPEETAQLRCSTDVLIHLPISDAFSATMCECLYAGATMITGSWLPYSPLRVNGVHYREISDVSDVPDALRLVVEDYEHEERMTRTTPPIIRDLVSWQAVAPQWRSLYDELLSEPGRTSLAGRTLAC